MTPVMLKHLCFMVALFCIAANYGCKAQDPIEIVAKAALCFDNRTVINGCLAWMGINVTGTANTTSSNSNTTALAPSSNSTGSNSTVSFCNSPCFGQMMLTMTCIDGVMSNFPAYNPGLMQGARAVLQMSCGIGNNGTATTGNNGGSLAPATGSGKTMVSNGNGPRISKQTYLRMSTLFTAICLLWC